VQGDTDDTTDTQSINGQETDEVYLRLCNNFPFGTTPVNEHAKDELYSFIPADETEAMIVIERFFLNVGWLYNLVPKRSLESIVRTLYDRNSLQLSAHRLAIFYMIMALNALVDQYPRPNGMSSHAYCQLARAALGVETIFGSNATLATVQALGLLSLWYQLADESGPLIPILTTGAKNSLTLCSDDPSKSWGCLGLTYKVLPYPGISNNVVTSLYRLLKVLAYIAITGFGTCPRKRLWIDGVYSGSYNLWILGKHWVMEGHHPWCAHTSTAPSLSIRKRVLGILHISTGKSSMRAIMNAWLI
jgi:hypothetical protein